MSPGPQRKDAIAFIDGQNLFGTAREAFGYTYPNYDVLKLAQAVCGKHGWTLKQVRFYTGIPDKADNPFWNHFWSAKLLAMSRAGAYTFSRALRYRTRVIRLPNGGQHSFLAGEEKGVDIRIALDVIRLALGHQYDVGLIFSQDQDLSEVAKEVRKIACEQRRWIKLASAYPSSAASHNRRGIDATDWIPIDKATFDGCIDARDYRPAKPPAP